MSKKKSGGVKKDGGGKRDDYEVGFGKPPKEHQFKPGQSGNPKGRPGNKSAAGVDVVAVLSEPVAIKENGEQREMQPFEAMARGLANKALIQKHIGSLLKLLKLFEKYGVIAPKPERAGGGVLVVPANVDFEKRPATDPNMSGEEINWSRNSEYRN